jgi:hypothetical protein
MKMPTGLTRGWVKVAIGVCAITALSLPVVELSAPAGAALLPGTPSDNCPAVDQDSNCGYLIIVGPGDAATVTASGQGPYDASDDVIVGIVNDSDALLSSVQLSGGSGNDIFGFDGDGMCTVKFTGNGYCSSLPPGSYGYEGPDNSYTNISSDQTVGTVSFTKDLAPGAGTYFSLEQGPFSVTSVSLAADIDVTGSAITGVEGNSTGPVTVATFTDGSDTSPVSDFSASISWGDSSAGSAGSISQPGGTGTPYAVTATHIYAEEGSYLTADTVTDVNLPTINTDAGDGSAKVADAPLTATATQPSIPDATTAKPFTAAVASFTDANPIAPLSDFTATIKWGDSSSSGGTLSQPGGIGTQFVVSGTHAYGSNGTYSISVTVNDVGGSTVTIANTVQDFDAVITCTSSPCSGTAKSATQTTGASTTSTSGSILLDLNNTPSVGAFSCDDPFRHAPQYSAIFSSGLAVNGSVDLTITFANSAAGGAWWLPFAVCYYAPGAPFKSLTGQTTTLGLLPICPFARPGHPVVGPCVQLIEYSTFFPLPFKTGTVTEQLVLPPNDPFSH